MTAHLANFPVVRDCQRLAALMGLECRVIPVEPRCIYLSPPDGFAAELPDLPTFRTWREMRHFLSGLA
jgi:hypothetical protein